MSEYTSKRLARALGWEELKSGKWGTVWAPPGDSLPYIDLPDFSADLNALHEVEMGLTEEQQNEYASKLAVYSNTNMFEPVWDPFRVATAPAHVRLRALIETLESIDRLPHMPSVGKIARKALSSLLVKDGE